ncbi:Dienelactone hydrolase [Natronoarchaeum philippinense]|uniref:Dienelactone hydrolase n=1 Tax=Natronoarchaeum philippinense TaxID=558529 RepID=A0A285N9R2_NATPI|nr:alpha/beta family hydrolase [Natronoarchaeum philippinense]SNZ04686.1 Dienelactone hydrolase [Natronoarchaeum philippinense]
MSDDNSNLVAVQADDIELEGELIIPEGAEGLVVFAHGAGSSRHSPRNNFVAESLRERGLGTLLFDLLTEQEDLHRASRFDIDLLTRRLDAATEWLRGRDDAVDLRLGYFGSSTGAAAALRAAARRDDIAAVVSRGGRVDLATDQLPSVTAPTLCIVGGDDQQVLALNRQALGRLDAEKNLHVVPGAGHLFEGTGELEEVATVAGEWFQRHLSGEQYE